MVGRCVKVKLQKTNTNQEKSTMFELGNKVIIKKEWLGSNEESGRIYEVVDVNEVTERCIIRPVESNLVLVPTELVGFEMIELVEVK